MGTLRREMTENGVEPRQIFAFDALGKKNAADIELVIDALDLAYTRPGISTFVVVTRDGGSRRSAASCTSSARPSWSARTRNAPKALRAVADAFVELPAPARASSSSTRPVAVRTVTAELEGERARNDARDPRDQGAGVARGRPLQERGVAPGDRRPDLRRRRAEAGVRALRDIRGSASFFSGHSPTRRTACSRDGSHFRVGLRTSRAADDALPPLDRRPPRVTEGVELYRLLASQGSPVLRLPSPDAAAQVLRAISKSGIRDKELASRRPSTSPTRSPARCPPPR